MLLVAFDVEQSLCSSEQSLCSSAQQQPSWESMSLTDTYGYVQCVQLTAVDKC